VGKRRVGHTNFGITSSEYHGTAQSTASTQRHSTDFDDDVKQGKRSTT
jgi:hypothetical protein